MIQKSLAAKTARLDFLFCQRDDEGFELFSGLRIDPGDYQKPAAEVIRDKLTAEQYAVTQESGTEYPYQNEFWNHFAKGIYVDIVTGASNPPVTSLR